MSSTAIDTRTASARGAVSSDEEARRLMADPGVYFDRSINEMHTIPRAKLDELQARAVAIRFAEQVERIPMLKKLADNQGIKKVDEVDALVPVLFEHTMYKSYPMSFLGNRRFDQLTVWLNKLTSVDLSKVDARKCDSIDSWLTFLQETTELDAACTSGSSGTMSFIPRTKKDIEIGLRSARVTEVQDFGKPVTDAAQNGLFHVIWPTYADGHLMSFRCGQYLKRIYGGGREDHFHPLYPEKGSSDLMWLAAQLRAAAAKGDASRVDVPPSLLARKGDLEKQQAGMGERLVKFIEDLSQELRGCAVTCMYPAYPLWMVTEKGLANGMKCEFAPESRIATAGGAKGMVLPDDWMDHARRFFGVERIERYYGMSEISGLFKLCSHGRYHVQPWTIPYLLDPDTSKLLPRKGVQVGRAAFFDIMITGHWGGIITGDQLEIDFDTPCGCGQTTVHMADRVDRYSVLKGGDDKISCAAVPQAHADALDFLTTFG